MDNAELAARTFTQIAVILLVSRAFGSLLRVAGQPRVIGEMLAGIALGPSLLGWLWPDLQGSLFPTEARGALYVISQIGLVLYMFLVGLEFRTDLARPMLGRAAGVSAAGVLLPMSLGALIATHLLATPGYFAPGINGTVAILFLGVAMSITAFPVLARIIEERGLKGTRLGTLSIAAASVDDATAWCILAGTLALAAGGTASAALVAVAGAAAYAAVATLVVRPALRRLAGKRVDDSTFAIVAALLFLGALATERIGVHAVFGAFVLGLAVPRGVFAESLQASLERPVAGILLPVFFAFSGLNTSIGLIGSEGAVLATVLVLGGSVLGKVAGCSLAARLSGENWRDALGVGALMNARGLMELVVINIALSRGLITPRLFTILVIMALATSLMTAPAFELTRRRLTVAASEVAARS